MPNFASGSATVDAAKLLSIQTNKATASNKKHESPAATLQTGSGPVAADGISSNDCPRHPLRAGSGLGGVRTLGSRRNAPDFGVLHFNTFFGSGFL